MPRLKIASAIAKAIAIDAKRPSAPRGAMTPGFSSAKESGAGFCAGIGNGEEFYLRGLRVGTVRRASGSSTRWRKPSIGWKSAISMTSALCA